MNDPRVALRTALAQWLRIRANVRRIVAKIAAGEVALQRDLRRSTDPELATLVDQLSRERRAIDELAQDLDKRIASLQGQFATVEAAFIQRIVGAARTARPTFEAEPHGNASGTCGC